MTSKPRISLFPRIALAVLDYVALLSAAFFTFIGVAAVARLPFLTLENNTTPLTAFLSCVIYASFFWTAHLVLRRSRFGQPFEKRNVQLLYWLAGMHLLYVIVMNNTLPHILTWIRKTNEVSRITFKLDSEAFAQFFIGSGLMLTLILFAFAAIFQRGVELREEEERLRHEAELTI